MDSNIYLEDTTLRDGEQGPGFAFSKETKVAIVDLLIKTGVRWIECGIPAMGGHEADALKALLDRKSEATLIAWNRGVKEDIKLSLDLGFTAIHIALPTSQIHLNSYLKRDRSWILQQISDLIKYGKDRGAYVSVGAEDVGRTDVAFLKKYAETAQAAGADRLRLADTIGILLPQYYKRAIEAVKCVSDLPIQCHTHNDFGLAVASALAGLEAGAVSCHTTVNGIGERAGNADLSQVALVLSQLYGLKLGIDFPRLIELSQFVEQKIAHPLPPWQPIVGKNIFLHESGIHTVGMLKDSSTFEPFPPELLGKKRHYVIGKHSGRGGFRELCDRNGIEIAEHELAFCLRRLKDLAMEQEKGVTVEQIYSVLQEMRSAH